MLQVHYLQAYLEDGRRHKAQPEGQFWQERWKEKEEEEGGSFGWMAVVWGAQREVLVPKVPYSIMIARGVCIMLYHAASVFIVSGYPLC